MKIHPSAAALLTEIEAFCRLTGTNETQFGLRAMNNSHFIHRLKTGTQPRLDTIDRVRAYMASKSKAARPFNGGK